MEHLTVSKEPVRFKGSRTKFSIKHLIVSNSQQVIQNIFVWTDRRSLKYHWVEVERISSVKAPAFLLLFEQIRCLLQLLGLLYRLHHILSKLISLPISGSCWRISDHCQHDCAPQASRVFLTAVRRLLTLCSSDKLVTYYFPWNRRGYIYYLIIWPTNGASTFALKV